MRLQVKPSCVREDPLRVKAEGYVKTFSNSLRPTNFVKNEKCEILFSFSNKWFTYWSLSNVEKC